VQLTEKLQGCNLFNVIGASFCKDGINQNLFYQALKDSEVGLMSPFGCNVYNAVRDDELNILKSPNIDEVRSMVEELTNLILKNEN